MIILEFYINIKELIIFFYKIKSNEEFNTPVNKENQNVNNILARDGNVVKRVKNKIINRINNRIYAREVRVISDIGEQLGIMRTRDAIFKAKSLGLDLVEVSSNSSPPVCKIIDYGKFKYKQKRKAAAAKKKQQYVDLKEIKFRPKTSMHDFNVKLNRLKKFLAHGIKGKIIVMFRGREIVHKDIGLSILKRISKLLGDDAIIETNAKMEGRQMIMIVGPAKH